MAERTKMNEARWEPPQTAVQRQGLIQANGPPFGDTFCKEKLLKTNFYKQNI